MPARTPFLRPLGALVSVGLALSLVACSEDEKPESPSQTEAGSAVEPDVEPETTPESTTEPTESDAVTADFCVDAVQVFDGTLFEGVEQGDLASNQTILDLAAQTMDAILAPSEIVDDWTLISNGTRTAADEMALLDPDSATVDQDQEDVFTRLGADELDTAAENIQAFVEDNCDPVE